MLRRIIHIDEEKCNGCGACAAACHEGAIGMVDGKARLMRDDYCDGLGDCLPACPANAITFVEREAAAYNEAAVMASKQQKAAENAKAGAKTSTVAQPAPHSHHGGGCPGHQMRVLHREEKEAQTGKAQHQGGCPGHQMRTFQREAAPATGIVQQAISQLGQWPCQIKLVPVNAPYFKGAKLLIAADCTAYAYADMHEEFMRGKITLIGCPKLDDIDYSEKLTAIIANNDIQSVTIVRMEVPCCGGLEMAAKKALQASGKFIPWQVVTISVDGRILDR